MRSWIEAGSTSWWTRVRTGSARGIPFHESGLAELLREHGVDHVYIGGLTTDYCVRNSALDARRLGFEVTVIEDATRR